MCANNCLCQPLALSGHLCPHWRFLHFLSNLEEMTASCECQDGSCLASSMWGTLLILRHTRKGSSSAMGSPRPGCTEIELPCLVPPALSFREQTSGGAGQHQIPKSPAVVCSKSAVPCRNLPGHWPALSPPDSPAEPQPLAGLHLLKALDLVLCSARGII